MTQTGRVTLAPSGSPGQGRILGLDLGTKRIGMAVTDETGTIASPLRVFTRRTGGLREAVAAIRSAVVETGACGIVVGYPLTFDGEVGTQARLAASFAEALRAQVDVPVVLHDERLTSFEAEQAMIEGGVPSASRKGRLDAVAASLILRSYLDSLEATRGAARGEPRAHDAYGDQV